MQLNFLSPFHCNLLLHLINVLGFKQPDFEALCSWQAEPLSSFSCDFGKAFVCNKVKIGFMILNRSNDLNSFPLQFRRDDNTSVDDSGSAVISFISFFLDSLPL